MSGVLLVDAPPRVKQRGDLIELTMMSGDKSVSLALTRYSLNLLLHEGGRIARLMEVIDDNGAVPFPMPTHGKVRKGARR